MENHTKMQKRARILDNRNIKRLQINRRGRSECNQNGSMSFFLARLVVTWLAMVGLDAMTGFRFELLWPTWLLIRAAGESIQMKNNHCVTTIANPASARFSVLFVCVTVTSDLMCHLFIPVRYMVFLATTYVWISLFAHTQGGFLRTIATLYGGERLQSWTIIFVSCFIISFEIFMRIRSHPILITVFPNVRDWAGMDEWPQTLNRFFAAHCIGYPVVLITFSLHYYLNEWKLRRKQCDVANRNENLFRILVESLPAEYEGPKDYSAQHQCLEENGDVYYLDPPTTVTTIQPLQAIQAAPSTSSSSTPPTTSSVSTSSKKNGVHRTTNSTTTSSKKRKNATNGAASSPNDKKKNGKTMREDVDLEDVDDSDGDDYFPENSEKSGGGIWIIRVFCDLATWAFLFVTRGSSSTSSSKSTSSTSHVSRITDEDDEDEDVEYEKKNGRTDSLTNSTTTTTSATTKNRSNTGTSSSSRHQNNNNNGKQKQNGAKSHHNQHQQHHQKTNGHRTTVRDSSHDTNASNETDVRSLSRDLDALRTELSQRRSLEEDFKLQISMRESNESRLAQQLSSYKMKVEQMEAKVSVLEKHRESDKYLLEQSERKYLDLLGKKADVEATLMAERKERIESASKKYDVAEHQRERERQLDAEVDKLRAELKLKEENIMRMESEIQLLRNYKEENDIESLHKELRFGREKVHQLEESLADENKLKQNLFKCLGEARSAVKAHESELAQLRQLKSSPTGGSSDTLMNGGSPAKEPSENETTVSDHSSPHQNSAMGSPIPFGGAPLRINVANRGGSPFNEKTMSPSMGGVLTGPPDYMMAVGGSPPTHKHSFPGIRYNEFKHIASGGEHRLFDSPQNAMTSSAGSATNGNGSANPDENDFLLKKGKFGAPSQPTARLA